MARSTQEIYEGLVQSKESESSLDGLTSTSQVALWSNILWVVAAAIHIFEQLMDSLVSEVETKARTAVSMTDSWAQNKILEFQYDETPGNEQVAQETSPGVIGYPVVNESLRIITRAAVKEQTDRKVLLKVAKGTDSLSALSNDEQNAAQGYANKFNPAGVPYTILSLEADRCRIDANIFYSGQFVESNVKAAVIVAIEGYFESISVDDFDGVININKLIDSVQAVEGVVDIDSQNMVVTLRAEQSVPGDSDNIIIEREQETFAGYVIGEDAAGVTLEDTLTFTLGN